MYNSAEFIFFFSDIYHNFYEEFRLILPNLFIAYL